ncbi:hypothetical protein FDI95_gp149 [Citrobacter phage CF1 ERZ-2017]|uniref:Uncharacterized protein n=2 Tax=Moonvirus TaxID=1985329 RepID=A0A0K1LNR5_9CAUD|nr:hypothetical protein CPT_Merlin154 [Citrobacter phage Merlin]YP_009618208.1 hypothetical protein FDI95_gp149 [Citrobacter phage CF1 ERZ-2017]AKU43800.1 hypothetical protein CPT_Merlin154 [Citrobacter phage Merlin]AUE23022.1 hypothetical protein Cf1_00149 [Citrobacter phage CF1 ERZ-2017]
MLYTVKINSGYVSGEIFNLAITHKQIILDLLAIKDDEDRFIELRIYFNSINPGLQAYFIRKIGAVQIDEYSYEA